MELFPAVGTTPLQSTPLNVTGTTVNGSFSSLTENTGYRLRLSIGAVECDFAAFNTLEFPCVAPTLLPTNIDYSIPQGDQTGQTIEAWVTEYETYFGPITP